MKIDIGCDDFRKAEQSRQMVACKEKTKAYERVEQAVRRKVLPAWVPRGELPYISLKELREKGGGFLIELAPKEVEDEGT